MPTSPTVDDQAPKARQSLWRHRDFRKLWASETVSLVGSEITELALPMTAILTLAASAGQVGLLRGAQFAPFLFVSLFAGIWVDRHQRRPMMITSELVRAVLIGLVPVSAVLGALSMPPLYVIALAFGTFGVLFDTAYLSYLPTLVGRHQLVEGNSKLGISRSAAEAGGPGLAGLLAQLLTAPIALVLDALSYLYSAFVLTRIRTPEPDPRPAAPLRWATLRAEIGDGIRIVVRNPYLRALMGEAATFNLFEQMFLVVFLVHAVRELGLSVGLVGLLIGFGAIGALVGAVWAPGAARWIGVGPALIVAMTVGNTAPIAVLAARDATLLSIVVLGTAFFLKGYGVGLSNVHTVSLRQSVTPNRLLGRMNASYRLLSYGPIPIGAVVGGFLAETIGQRPTIMIAVVGLSLATLWVVWSPIPRLRDINEDDLQLTTGPAQA